MLNDNAGTLLVLAFAMVGMGAFWHQGIPYTSDFSSWVSYLVEFHSSVMEGHIYSRWFSNVFGGYGLPFLSFMSPLAILCAEAFVLLGFGAIASVKAVFCLAVLLFGLGVYLVSKDLFDVPSAVVAATAAMFCPEFCKFNFLVGNAGVVLGLAFFSLSLWAVSRLNRDRRPCRVPLAGLFLAGMYLSHAMLAACLSLFLIPYCLFLIARRRIRIYPLLLSVLIALGAGAFYWLPLIFESALSVNPGALSETTGDLYNTSIKALIPGLWRFDLTDIFLTSKELGSGRLLEARVFSWWILLLPALAVALALTQKRLKEGLRPFILLFACLAAFGTGLFILIETSANRLVQKIFITPKLFHEVLPYSLAAAQVFLAVLIGGLAFLLARNGKTRVKQAAPLLCLVILVSSYNYCRPLFAPFADEDFHTDAIRESTSAFAFYHAFPKWVRKTPVHRARGPRSLDAKIDIETTCGQGLSRAYRLTASAQARLLTDVLYYPGWRAFLDGERIKTTPSRPTGQIEVIVPKGTHTLNLRYGATSLQSAAGIISLLFFLGAFGAVIFKCACPFREWIMRSEAPGLPGSGRGRLFWIVPLTAAAIVLFLFILSDPVGPLDGSTDHEGCIKAGISALDEGEPKLAMRYFLAARRLRPDWAVADLSVAMSTPLLDDIFPAFSYVSESLKHDPRNPVGHAYLATLLSRWALRDALAEYREAIRLRLAGRGGEQSLALWDRMGPSPPCRIVDELLSAMALPDGRLPPADTGAEILRAVDVYGEFHLLRAGCCFSIEQAGRLFGASGASALLTHPLPPACLPVADGRHGAEASAGRHGPSSAVALLRRMDHGSEAGSGSGSPPLVTAATIGDVLNAPDGDGDCIIVALSRGYGDASENVARSFFFETTLVQLKGYILSEIPASGELYVAAFIDRNGNRRLDLDRHGTPMEPTAFHRTEGGRLECPSAADAFFDEFIFGAFGEAEPVDLSAGRGDGAVRLVFCE